MRCCCVPPAVVAAKKQNEPSITRSRCPTLQPGSRETGLPTSEESTKAKLPGASLLSMTEIPCRFCSRSLRNEARAQAVSDSASWFIVFEGRIARGRKRDRTSRSSRNKKARTCSCPSACCNRSKSRRRAALRYEVTSDGLHACLEKRPRGSEGPEWSGHVEHRTQPARRRNEGLTGSRGRIITCLRTGKQNAGKRALLGSMRANRGAGNFICGTDLPSADDSATAATSTRHADLDVMLGELRWVFEGDEKTRCRAPGRHNLCRPARSTRRNSG